MSETTNKARIYLMLIVTNIIWGIQPICIKWLLVEWSPITITYMRYFVMSILLFSLLVWHHGTKDMLPHGKDWYYILGMAFFGVPLNSILQFTGLEQSTVVNCSIITATSPAITALFAVLLIKEKLTLLSWSGIVVSFVGALSIICQGSLLQITHLHLNHGDILFFLSQIAWTLYSILGLKVMQHMSAMSATAWAGFLGAIMTLVYSGATDTIDIAPLSALPLFSFLFLVMLGGIMAMIFWNLGVKEAGPSMSSIFQNISLVVGMAGGAIAFNESISTMQIIGAGAIFCGVYLTAQSHHIAFMLLRKGLRGVHYQPHQHRKPQKYRAKHIH